MKFKLLLPVLLTLALAACTGAAKTPTALPTVILGANVSTPAPGSSSAAGVTASGVVVADQQASMAFKLAGNVKLIQVVAGDQVKAGQPLVQLDDTSQLIQLEQAKLVLQELTSPSALAAAQKALAQDQIDVDNAQYVLSDQLYFSQNTPAIQNAQAALTLAEDRLKTANQDYADVSGNPDTSTVKARAYQTLYAAQQDYNNALYVYNLWSGKNNQQQIDVKAATLAMLKAKLADDQTLVAALTGGTLPEHPTGTGYAALMQANFNIQAAQASLDATRLVAPFSGQVASVTTSVGDYVSPGQVILVISDINHMHVETTDLSERDIPMVKLGQSVTVTVKALNQDVEAQVSAISPLANTLGGDVVYKVTITLGDLPSNLRAGMSVDVQFKTSP
jgi:multidrug efflux pump subunit AcrA (membrane-fusion protein)